MNEITRVAHRLAASVMIAWRCSGSIHDRIGPKRMRRMSLAEGEAQDIDTRGQGVG